jgi:DNA primase
MYDEVVNILSSKLGSHYRKGNQISFYCPKHTHHKRKLDINLDKGVFHCWICEYGGHISKLCFDIGISEDDKKILQELYPKKDGLIKKQEAEPPLDDKFANFFNDNSRPFVTPIRSIGTDNLKNKSLRYLLDKRQVSKEDIIKFSIQYGISDKYKNSIMFPSFNNNGKINGVTVRYFASTNMKYFQFRQQDSIWNDILIEWDDPIYIVEGAFDYLRINGNALCLAGSLINDQSRVFKKLSNHKNYKYFCLDNDATFKSINIIKKLLKIGIDDIFILDWRNNSHKDIGEFSSKEESMKFIKNNLRSVTLSNVDILELQYKMGI